MKLFVTDYDDTLYVDNESIKKTNKLLKELQKNGFYIVIATGRGYPSINNQTTIHEIPYDYITCSDGSAIYNNQGVVEEIYTINKEIIKPFEEFYQDVNFEELQFSYPEGYSNILNNDNDNLLGVNICVSNENYTKELVDKFTLMSKVYQDYSFLNYIHPNFSYLCIKPKGISKAASIEYIRKKHKIKKEDVYVIGDASNDYEMIRDYNGVCVSTPFEEIIKIAKKVYPTIDDYIMELLKED